MARLGTMLCESAHMLACCFMEMHSADTIGILYAVSQPTEITYNTTLLQVAKNYLNAREALIVNGNFLLTHFKRMDTAAGGKATFAFSSTPFTAALKEEVKPRSLSAGLCSTSGIDLQSMQILQHTLSTPELAYCILRAPQVACSGRHLSSCVCHNQMGIQT